jgi:7,8-dihydroneopterin aldolase/epimerase/oxygenase
LARRPFAKSASADKKDRVVLDVNVIIIKGLRIDATVGVTDAERKNPQRLEVDAVITPLKTFTTLADEIARTVDYHAAAERIAILARSRPRRLIETLARELAEMLVSEFPASQAEVEVRKFVVPNTDYVAVRCACPRMKTLRPGGRKRKADLRRDR